MSELLQAAKAVIKELNEKDTWVLTVDIEDRLRAAVERAEKQEDEPVAWLTAEGYVYRSRTVARHSNNGKEPLPLYLHQPIAERKNQ